MTILKTCFIPSLYQRRQRWRNKAVTFYMLYISYTHTHTHTYTYTYIYKRKKGKFFRKYGYQLRILSASPPQNEKKVRFLRTVIAGGWKAGLANRLPWIERPSKICRRPAVSWRETSRWNRKRPFRNIGFRSLEISQNVGPKKYPRIHRSGSKTLGWAWNWRTAANGGVLPRFGRSSAPSPDYPGK